MPCSRPPPSTQKTLRNRYSVTLPFASLWNSGAHRKKWRGFSSLTVSAASPQEPSVLAEVLLSDSGCSLWPSVSFACLVYLIYLFHSLLSLYPMTWLLRIHACFFRGAGIVRPKNINSRSLTLEEKWRIINKSTGSSVQQRKARKEDQWCKAVGNDWIIIWIWDGQ